MNVECKEASLTEFKKLINFYRTYYEDDNKIFKDGYLDWFLLNNPNGKSKIITITLDEVLISCMFLIPVRFKTLDKVKSGYFVADVLTHQDHRDKNLFVKMIRYAVEIVKSESAFIMGHPNRYAIPGWKRTKMKFSSPIRSYLSKPSLINKERKVVIETASQLKEIFNNHEPSCYSIIDPDPDYLSWRFLKHPVNKYKIEAIYSHEQLLAVEISYKFKVFDRVIHSIMFCNDSSVIFPGILPKIYHVSDKYLDSIDKISLFTKPIGSEINCFLTSYDSDISNIENLGFAGCDN